MPDDEITPERPWWWAEADGIDRPFEVDVRRIGAARRDPFGAGGFIDQSFSLAEKFTSLDGSPLVERCPFCNDLLAEREEPPPFDWSVGDILGIVGPPSQYVALVCRSCRRDNDLLAPTSAWPALLELRQQRADGTITATEFIDRAVEAVRSRVVRTELVAEVRNAIAGLADERDGDAPAVGLRRFSMRDLGNGRPHESTHVNFRVPWTAIFEGFNASTGDSIGQWQLAIDDLVNSISAERLGPHGRAMQWLAEPGVGRRWFHRQGDSASGPTTDDPGATPN